MPEGRGETCDNAFLAFRRLCRSSLQVGPFGPAATLHTEDWLVEPEGTEPNRIAEVCAFLEAPDARLQLSIACLCLRLTTVATSMTAKKNAGMPTTPLLVQLARGDVTKDIG